MSFQYQVEDRSFLRRLDSNFALVILALNIVGLINLYSATHGLQSSGWSRLFIMQIAWLTVGWILLVSLTVFNYRLLSRFILPIYVLNVAAIIAVTFVGNKALGAQRWLDLGFFKYQPSETMKIALVLMLAKVISKRIKPEGLGFKDLIVPAIITGVPFVFVVKQPDLGTALTFLMITGSMLFFAKLKTHVIATAFIVAIISIPIAWNFGLKEYQKNRVLTFLSPGRDPRGTGYNSIQSKIAVGSGNVLGKGFRKGTQSQLEFLPERHTDFIFSVLSEEHGFIGSTTTIGLFMALFLIATRIATQARDRFGVLLVVGLAAFVFWHFFVNIGMVIGLLPIVGVPLPLLSYGGSSTLATMVSLGLISSVAYHRFIF